MSDLHLLKNTEILDLFEIKLNDFEGYFRFHGSKNLTSDIVFAGKSYLYIPSEVSNLEYTSDGKQNRPTLSIANVNNYINNFIKDRNDLLGKRFYRKKILAKDLDAENFGEANKNLLGVSNFVDFISVDTYVIHKKNSASKEKVEFELANTMDIDGQTAPARKVYNDTCQWQYRGCGCNYGKISGWDGAKVQIRPTRYATLADATDPAAENLITLSLHLMSTAGTTYSGSVYYVDRTWPVLTAWVNQAAATPTVTIAGSPKQYVNSGRMNGITGILFGISKDGVADTLQINNNYNTNFTVFYVSEMVKKGARTNTRMGLGVADKSWFVGYGDGVTKSQDACRSPSISSNTYLSKLDTISPLIDTPNIYAMVAPTSSSAESVFYKNGSIVAKSSGFTNSPNNMGLNLAATALSDIVIYEIIIFNELLVETQVKGITNYLATKYGITTTEEFTPTESKKSSDFFTSYPNDGDLGVPIADENDKIFMGPATVPFSNGSSYGMQTMTYKGDYNPETAYSRGDFVKIDTAIDYDFNERFINKNNEPPSRFFVLNSEFSSGKSPFLHTKDWVEDKCSRKLNGCSLRFKDLGFLPFGAFPGTVTYDYKLPG
jgi:lambda family phage minor tail protein L